MRWSKHYSPRVQGGLLTGYAYKGWRLEAPTADTPNGQSHVALARTDARLIPLMGYAQIDLTETFFLAPFVGIGVGYEWLTLHKSDYVTGQESTAPYGNFAWEGYIGLGVRLKPKVRLNTELFYNGGSLERRVFDPDGSMWREAVHVNGVGARVGLDMVYWTDRL
jgi:hypothetical protein